MTALERIWIIFSKEVIDNLRDRRSMISSMSSSLIGPGILLVMIVIIGKTLFADQQEKPLSLPVQGAENAPTLIRFFEQYNVKISPAPDDPQTAVRNGDQDVVLIIPDSFQEDFSAGRPATVQFVTDSSRQSAIAKVQRAQNLLSSYNSQIAALRLTARGISPVVIEPLAIEDIDVATPQSQALIFLNMMPYFIIFTVFIGGMYVIIDSTAGERERGSLEPLLINPAARWEFVIGKLAASLPFAIFTVFLTLLAFAAAFNLVPLEDYVGFQLSLDVRALGGIFLISLPMILFASALQMIIATFTRSFKEAQTYVGFLPLIPALPGIGLAFMPIKPTLATMLIPTFGQQLLINQLMRGEPVNILFALISALATGLAAVLLVYVAIRMYQQDRILFGTR